MFALNLKPDKRANLIFGLVATSAFVIVLIARLLIGQAVAFKTKSSERAEVPSSAALQGET